MAQMNNFTTAAESLPKSGHVNEVCKEWLVREDGALAYKLQSQEIHDYYKGNRFRNAVVREDFPTALQEQIKEKKSADHQTEIYRRKLKEQEEYDKRVAREISLKLEKDLNEQRRYETQQGEKEAHKLQKIYVNMPPLPPPKYQVPPPRPAKSLTLKQQQQYFYNTDNTTANAFNSNNRKNSQHLGSTSPTLSPLSQSHYSLQLQQHHFTGIPEDNDSSLDLKQFNDHATNNSNVVATAKSPTNSIRRKSTLTTSSSPSSSSLSRVSNYHNQQQQHPRNSEIMSSQNIDNSSEHKSYSPSHAAVSNKPMSQVFSYAPRTASTNCIITTNSTLTTTNSNINTSNITSVSSLSTPVTENLSMIMSGERFSKPNVVKQQFSQENDIDELVEYSDVADSICQFNISKKENLHQHQSDNSNRTHNIQNVKNSRILSPSLENLLSNDPLFQKLSPQKYDQLVGNKLPGYAHVTAAERHMQQHADDIELYVDPCNYASLQEIGGLPMTELKKISEKIKQEQKDELLARRLQEMEINDGLSQEERDRLMAIETQDKELAKMLQEREKAKIKRAKEKARQRKKEIANAVSVSPQSNQDTSESYIDEDQSHDDLDVEPYSNPLDVIKHSQQYLPQQHQRLSNGCLTNGSLNRNDMASQQARQASLSRDDDIYTLPVDSCHLRSTSTALSDKIAKNAVYSQNSMTRSENISIHSHDSSTGSRLSATGTNGSTKTTAFDQTVLSPTPPYMPIQGTRRSNSNEDRKKKSKDNKCTHQ